MRRISLIALFVISFTAVGCGPSYKIYPVTGKVTLDGSPLAGATVMLKPVAADGKPASGTCDKDGVYSVVDMRPEAAAGASPGEYTVGILWYKPSEDSSQASGSSAGTEDSAASRSKVDGPKSDLPAAYQNADTSGLTLTVKAESNKADFALDSKFKGKAK